MVIPKGSVFWRARLGCDSVEVTREETDITVVYPEDRPYGRDGMKPIPNWQGEDRSNPRGIPALYLATTRDTALAEVRPWVGATISVAQLVIESELNVIDCSKYHARENFIDVVDDPTKSREDGNLDED
jgi:hypothetical protein